MAVNLAKHLATIAGLASDECCLIGQETFGSGIHDLNRATVSHHCFMHRSARERWSHHRSFSSERCFERPKNPRPRRRQPDGGGAPRRLGKGFLNSSETAVCARRQSVKEHIPKPKRVS